MAIDLGRRAGLRHHSRFRLRFMLTPPAATATPAAPPPVMAVLVFGVCGGHLRRAAFRFNEGVGALRRIGAGEFALALRHGAIAIGCCERR